MTFKNPINKELFSKDLETITNVVHNYIDTLSNKELTEMYHYMLVTNHNDKMLDMISLSTSVLMNPFCMARIKKAHDEIKENPLSTNTMICVKCFAEKQLKRFTNQNAKQMFCHIALTYKVYPVSVIPWLNVYIFRLESFGDLANVTQAINYLNIVRKNPHVSMFSLWTKNPNILAQAFKETGYEKPSNMNVIHSSLYINVCDDSTWKKYTVKGARMIDKVFTVYTKEYAELHNIAINCGARHCFTCRLCYKKDTVQYINELLK